MLRQLKLQLMLVCTIMTSAVFLLLFAFNYYSTVSRYRQLSQRSFEDLTSMISEKITTQAYLDDAWLGDIEAQNQCIISVSNNGQELFFRGAWMPKSNRAQLIALANKTAFENDVDISSPPVSWETASTVFGVKGENSDRYRTSVTVFPPRNEKWLGLTVLQSDAREQRYIGGLLLNYAVISVVAIAVLFLLSRWLSNKAIRPTAQSLEKQKTFIASASHELRSPLAVIQTSASAIKLAPERTMDMLDNIEAECTFLGNLVDDLLLATNMDTGCWNIDKHKVDVDTVLIEIEDKMASVAKSQGYCLTLSLPEQTLPEIVGDAERLSQVLTILIDNAIVHSEKPDEICLAAKTAGSYLVLQVIDHGTGIPPELREKIFDRFFSSDPSRSNRKHSGLGLSIAKELVLLHGGELSIRETNGGGCTFEVKLPIP